MDLRDIKRLVELITENKLTEFELEKEGFKLSVKREGPGERQVVVQQAPAPVAFPTGPVHHAPPPGPAAPEGAPPPPGSAILSPMVGTFYRSSSPESDPFVSVGQSVEPDTVVCIVEAMKVMNEIKAECSGVIKKVLIEDSTPVEYDQPLFEIEPA